MEKTFETKEFKIQVPDGYKIDKENSTFEAIKFIPIERKLPKTWKEYCEMHEVQIGETWQTDYSGLIDIVETRPRDSIYDRNLLPNMLYGKSILAFCQLIQLRDYYNYGWVPNWLDMSSNKYCILIACNEVDFVTCNITQKVLAFKIAELRDDFAENFNDLIEIAKPFL